MLHVEKFELEGHKNIQHRFDNFSILKRRANPPPPCAVKKVLHGTPLMACLGRHAIDGGA